MKWNDLHPNIKWRFVVDFCSITASTMIIPYLAIYFSGKVGATLTGILFVIVIMSGVIGSFVGGYLSDLIGRKKIMLMSELIVALTFYVIAMLNSPWFEFPYVTAGIFVINMFFSGCFHPVVMALILDSSTSASREGIFRINYWISNLAIAVGSLVGGFLFSNHHFLLFLIIATVSLLSSVITALFLTEEYHPSATKEVTSQSEDKQTYSLKALLRQYGGIFKDRVFLFFILGGLLVTALESQLTNYIGVRLSKDMGETALFAFGHMEWSLDGTELLGVLKSENTILVVVGTFLITKVTKRLSHHSKLLGGGMMFVIGYVALSMFHHPLILIGVMLLATCGELIYVPVEQAIMGDIVPDDSRSTYMAFQQMALMISEIIAGLFITLGSFLTAGMMSLILFIMGMLGVFNFYIMLRKKAGRDTAEVHNVG
ncbi:MFS transporter [Tuberibacillus sp. Marseille-P3662]|uniref:MFS transporter n=1 Tax=Tuberibacillus sp. Marseille-P3662 TaxID=1965358 RepID=UPI000A1C976A|nr:MFS transporter [Tuberibacillus sp. Marseille-P3662]